MKKKKSGEGEDKGLPIISLLVEGKARCRVF